MKLNRIATPLMAVVLMSGAPIFAHAQNSQKQNTPAQVQDWNTPPAGTEQVQQGFRDGIEAAKLDKAAKRKIDAKSSHLYKNPPVKGAAKDDYRNSFEKGYQAQLEHDNAGM
ncbi:hypothetical protein [Edaphobacter modestus]|jgi:hypothetical protein|uniref:DUF4148 domain-containing protein n=1 Tax=Edaphobacter modestus TaxID=388466 RepID=A0A4Q7YUM4_9BACT|nr:hypothetical protein [Edaphobacter modestus]RZU41572.1 hypothetical protein BDD14_3097 [Edaphobacter modestus]